MENIPMPHKLTLNERKSLTATGVKEVIRFDDTVVVLSTVLGTLEVQGQGLVLKTLSIDGGQVAVEGTVEALYYEQLRQKGGFRGRHNR